MPTIAETPPATPTSDPPSADDARSARPGRLAAALAGVAAAAAGLGAGEAVAGSTSWLRSPVLDVGDRVIDRVPAWLKNLAIDWFGTNDKIALLAGIGATLVVYAAVVGVVAFRRSLRVGQLGIALFGVVGALAATASRTGTDASRALPSLVGAAVAVVALEAIARVMSSTSSDRTSDDASLLPRRRFLVAIGVTGAAGVSLGALGRWLESRFTAADSRAAITLPRAASPLPAAGPGVQAPSAASFYTPNADFYRIDTALSVPQVPADGWSLRVTGLVDRPLELSYAEVLDRRLVESDITLTCVSNTVGGGLIGTARWFGIRLDDLLAEAGVDPRADQVVGRSVDGYTCGFPVSALDGRDALVAIGMNGEPLPLEHGFPARLIVPGIYGYASATKWLSEIELTTFDAFDHYWVPRGYAELAPIKLQSRIDAPRGLDRIAPGPFVIGGVAWAQTIGIADVEVRIDGGPWTSAELADELNDTTWRQWSLPWDATPGRHSIAVRAIDRTGAIQTDARSEPLPDGATGHHTVVVLVDET